MHLDQTGAHWWEAGGVAVRPVNSRLRPHTLERARSAVRRRTQPALTLNHPLPTHTHHAGRAPTTPTSRPAP
jgi:hypothetical protein